jgi:hypothetical protein
MANLWESELKDGIRRLVSKDISLREASKIKLELIDTL